MTKSPAPTVKFITGDLLSGDRYLGRYTLLRAEVGRTRLTVQQVVRPPVRSPEL
uniref:Uncharacterized protein n=2 Tax=Solanum TaxID=4107 RepID=M1ASS4_SOLTU